MWENLIQALDDTEYAFAHFGWAKNAPETRGDFGVYAEDSERALYANDKRAEHLLQGTIDYYTRDDSDTPRVTIETALDNYNIPFSLNSIQFEPDTGYIHYEWVFEAVR